MAVDNSDHQGSGHAGKFFGLTRPASRLSNSGQALAEYIIGVILIAIVVLVAVRMFGESAKCEYGSAGQQIDPSGTQFSDDDCPVSAAASSPGSQPTAAEDETEPGGPPPPAPPPSPAPAPPPPASAPSVKPPSAPPSAPASPSSPQPAPPVPQNPSPSPPPGNQAAGSSDCVNDFTIAGSQSAPPSPGVCCSVHLVCWPSGHPLVPDHLKGQCACTSADPAANSEWVKAGQPLAN